MVAALRCVRPQFQWYQLAYATEIKSYLLTYSIQLHDSIEGLNQKIVSSTLQYITYMQGVNKYQIFIIIINMHYSITYIRPFWILISINDVQTTLFLVFMLLPDEHKIRQMSAGSPCQAAVCNAISPCWINNEQPDQVTKC